MKFKFNLFLIMGITIIFLLISIIVLGIVHIKTSQEDYNYGCVRGCYYAIFSNESTPVFAWNNDIYVCMLKCVKDYGDWR